MGMGEVFAPSLQMLLTLHHLHLLAQGHPEPFGGGLCQEPPGVFISRFSRNTVLWLLLMLLQQPNVSISASWSNPALVEPYWLVKLYLYESWRRFLVAASQETIWHLILSSCKINYFWSQLLFLNVADRWRDQRERCKLRAEFVWKLLRVLLLTMSPRVLSSALLGCAFLSLRDVCPDRVWMSCVFCSRLCPPFLLFFFCPTLSQFCNRGASSPIYLIYLTTAIKDRRYANRLLT